jgi:carbon monoxide dehydrogenase subunit G
VSDINGWVALRRPYGYRSALASRSAYGEGPMQMRGERMLAASRDDVWVALNDPEVLRLCIPGCESIERISDAEYLAAASARIGPGAARFLGTVRLSEVDPPNGYRLTAEAQSATAGCVSGGAFVTLAAHGDATLISYDIEATVGGELARLGGAVVDAMARRLAEDFFARFEATVARSSDQAPPSAEPSATSAPISAASQPAPLPARAGVPPTIWVPALMLVVAMMLWLVA